MKKEISSALKVLLSISLVILMFTGCSKSGDESNATTDNSAATGPNNPGVSARIEYQVEDHNKNNNVEIPIFKSNLPSESITQINNDISFLNDVYTQANNNKLKWPEIITHEYTTKKYLQAIVEYGEMPSIDLDHDVVTFVYDREKDKAISIDNALDTAGYTSVQFDKLINNLFKAAKVNGKLSKYDIYGFYISKSNEIEFFLRLHIITDSEEYSQVCTVIPSKNQLMTTDGNGIKIVE